MAKLTGKKPVSAPFNKVAGSKPANIFKRDSPTQVFSCKFCKNFQNTFFKEDVRATASENILTENVKKF